MDIFTGELFGDELENERRVEEEAAKILDELEEQQLLEDLNLGPPVTQATFDEKFVCPSITGRTYKTPIAKISENQLHCVDRGKTFECSGTMKVHGDTMITVFEVDGAKSTPTYKGKKIGRIGSSR